MVMKLIGFWLWLMTTMALGGSPFYLTVERSYIKGQIPQVRIDYNHEQPFLKLRILKPVDTRAFLAKHHSLSRAYETPRTQLNPGHYLIRGLNRLNSPLRDLQQTFPTDLRLELKAGIADTIRYVPQVDLAKEPPKMHLATPEGLQLVDELFIDLAARKDELQEDKVPGFEDWHWRGRDRYRQSLVDLPKLDAGIYLVQGIMGSDEGQALLQVTDLSLQVKQSERELVTWALEPVSLKGAEGLKVWIKGPSQTWKQIGDLDANGVLFYKSQNFIEGNLLVMVEGEGRFGLVSTDFMSSTTHEDSLFLMTDRPMFKPGDAVSFKGILRADGLPKQASLAKIHLKDKSMSLASVESLPLLNGYGSFSGELNIPKEVKPGLYQIEAQIAGQTVEPYRAEFRVKDYKKPSFFLRSVKEEGALLPGSPYRLTLKAEKYAGGTPPQARYEVFVYRRFYEEPQWLEEAGGGLDAGLGYDGAYQKAASQTVPIKIYSSLDLRTLDHKAKDGEFKGSWASASAFQDGLAEISLSLPATLADDKSEWHYTLLVKVHDHLGETVVFRKSFYDTYAQAILQLATKSRVLIDTKPFSVALKGSTPDGRPLGGMKGYVDLYLEHNGIRKRRTRKPFALDSSGKGELELVPPSGLGIVVVEGYLNQSPQGVLSVEAAAEPLHLLKPRGKSEPLKDNDHLELHPAKRHLRPGEVTQVLALLPRSWGVQESGPVGVTISSSAIEQAKTRSFAGRTLILNVSAPQEGEQKGQGSGFYYTLTVPMAGGRFQEETIGFRLIQPNRLLRVDVATPNEDVEPYSEISLDVEVKNHLGQSQPGVEVLVAVIDQAAFDLSGSLRPGLVDFFYPLPRKNMQSFAALNLKGFGYAAAIRDPNFYLSALKAEPKTVMKDDKDTAAFLPHLITDANGRVKATFKLPGNETKWRVEAVAIDREGRVGEGLGVFRSTAKISVRLNQPLFVRQGDALSVPITFANRGSGVESLGLSWVLDPSWGWNREQLPSELKIPPKEESTFWLELNAKTILPRPQIELALSPQNGRRQVRSFRIQTVEKGFVQEISAGPKLGAKELAVVLPADGQLVDLEIHMEPGLLHLVQRAARYLVRYPFGCTEQLVSATLPNLLVKSILKDAGQLDLWDYERAKAHAATGMQRLLQRQQEDGGFAMWPGESQSHFAASVIAMEGLLLAKELGAEIPYGVTSKGRQYLKQRFANDFDLADGGESYLALKAALITQNWQSLMPDLASYQGQSPSAQWAVLEAMARHEKLRPKVPLDRQKIFVQGLKDFIQRDSKAQSKGTVSHRLGFPTGTARLVAASMGTLHRLGQLDDKTYQSGVGHLAAMMPSGYWQSTFDSAQALISLRALMAAEAKKWERQPMVPKVYGHDSGPLGIAQAHFPGYTLKLAGPVGTVANLTSLRIENLPADYWVSAHYKVATVSGAMDRAQQGFVVKRRIYKVEGDELQELKRPYEVAKGDTLVNQVAVQISEQARSQPWGQMVVLKDPVPSFAKAIAEDREILAQYGLVDSELMDHIKETIRESTQVVRVLKWPADEEVLRLSQAWEVEFSGTVSLPPASAYAMYAEDLRGHGLAEVLRSR